MVRPTKFEITQRSAGATLNMSVTGELDMRTVGTLSQHLNDALGQGITALTLDRRELACMSALATAMLLVSEVVTNAVIHPDVKPPAPIRMRAGVTPEVIRVEIKDRGSGFTPRPRAPSRLHGGYGLYLLDKEALRWGVRQDEGNTLWFEVSSDTAQETSRLTG